MSGSTSGAGLEVTSNVAVDVSVVNDSSSYGASSNHSYGLFNNSGMTMAVRGGTFSSNGVYGVLGFGSGSNLIADSIVAQSNGSYNVVGATGTNAMSVSNSHVTPATLVFCNATTCNYTAASGSGNF